MSDPFEVMDVEKWTTEEDEFESEPQSTDRFELENESEIVEGLCCDSISVADTDSIKPETAGPRRRYQRFREKTFICDQCDSRFTLKQNVQMHIFNYHIGQNQVSLKRDKRFKCSECEQIFRTLASAQKHEARAHKQKAPPQIHQCEQCERIFKSPSQLREHVSIVHLNERPFQCEKCDASFGRRGGLRRHYVMVHTDHVFKCPYKDCEHPGYKCSKALKAHIRSVHTKERPFECSLCDKTFVRRNDLKMHEQTHEASTKYSCEYCNQPFKRLVYMRKHQRICPRGPNAKAKQESTLKWSDDEDDDYFDVDLANYGYDNEFEVVLPMEEEQKQHQFQML